MYKDYTIVDACFVVNGLALVTVHLSFDHAAWFYYYSPKIAFNNTFH